MNTIARKLKQLVCGLALPEGRMVGTPGHEEAKAFLLEEFAARRFAPYLGESFEIPYKRRGVEFSNLIAVVPGRNRRKKPILVGGHHDSVIDAPCADDNAAAVAIALEVGSRLLASPPERDTIIALFDAEEPPYYETSSMGSIRFYEDQMKQERVHAAVVMDLVGHDIELPVSLIPWAPVRRFPSLRDGGIPVPRLRKLLFMTGAESHPALGAAVKSTSTPSGLHLMLTPNRNVGDVSDHGVFRRNGVPYLFLSCGRWQHYHSPTDTPERLNYAKMARIAQYLEGLVRSLNGAELPKHAQGETDTAELEIRCLKKVCGPLLPLVLRLLGVDRLEGREDLDELAGRLLQMGL